MTHHNLLEPTEQWCRYAEESRNCQTFAADFYSYLTGQPQTPFSQLQRVLYAPKVEQFMYDPEE
jgi:hypothetical protein